MQCLVCKQDNDRVVDSRSCANGGAIRRRRECLSCGSRFTTYERPEVASRMVIKKDGRREPFDRVKVLRGMRIACQKRQVSTDQLEKVVDRIETGLFGESDREVSARAIGEKVIGELKSIDQVAYVRFASVYLDFAGVAEFAAALAPFLSPDARARMLGGAAVAGGPVAGGPVPGSAVTGSTGIGGAGTGATGTGGRVAGGGIAGAGSAAAALRWEGKRATNGQPRKEGHGSHPRSP